MDTGKRTLTPAEVAEADRLIAEIHPSRTLDLTARRADESVNTFAGSEREQRV